MPKKRKFGSYRRIPMSGHSADYLELPLINFINQEIFSEVSKVICVEIPLAISMSQTVKLYN